MAALLAEGQVRGRDASGYAWVSPTGDGVYKKDVPGSRLHVGQIPSDATAVIAHTRAATLGSPRHNENNHPVISPLGDIRLVHNGVIWNHEEVRDLFPSSISEGMPEVDTAVIGAVIENFGLDDTSQIEGDAACAWFDRETGDTIHLAKFQNSPVSYAVLEDGSFVFASTPSILASALTRVGLVWYGNYPEPFASMKEQDYFQIMSGEVVVQDDVEWGDEYGSRYAYNSQWRHVTSGATQSTYSSGKNGSENTPLALEKLTGDDGELNEAGKKVVQEIVKSRTIIDPDAPEEGDPDFEEFMDHPEYDDPDYREEGLTSFKPLYYTYMHDGDYATYTTLSGLLAALSWHSKLSGGENLLVGPDEKELRWINHFSDIGALSADDTDELSWVQNSGAMDPYRQQVPVWVRDGVDKLRMLVGA